MPSLGIKLIESKTKTMIVSRSRTMHPQSSPLTIDGTVLKDFDDYDMLGVTFDSKITLRRIFARFRDHLLNYRLGILRKSWRVFHDRLLLGRCFRGFALPVLEYCSALWCSTADTLDLLVNGSSFLAVGVLGCDLEHQ